MEGREGDCVRDSRFARTTSSISQRSVSSLWVWSIRVRDKTQFIHMVWTGPHSFSFRNRAGALFNAKIASGLKAGDITRQQMSHSLERRRHSQESGYTPRITHP